MRKPGLVLKFATIMSLAMSLSTHAQGTPGSSQIEIEVIYMGLMVIHDDPNEDVLAYFPRAYQHEMAIYEADWATNQWERLTNGGFSPPQTVRFLGSSSESIDSCGLTFGTTLDHSNKSCPDWIMTASEISASAFRFPTQSHYARVILPDGRLKNCGFVHDQDKKVCIVKSINGAVERPVSEYASVTFSQNKPAKLVIERSNGQQLRAFEFDQDTTLAIVNLPPLVSGPDRVMTTTHGAFLRDFFEGTTTNWNRFDAAACHNENLQPACFWDKIDALQPTWHVESGEVKVDKYAPRSGVFTIDTTLGVSTLSTYSSAICPFVDYP